MEKEREQAGAADAWVMRAMAWTVSGPGWDEQLQLLRTVAQFDATRRDWFVYFGHLDEHGRMVLNTLFAAAQAGAHVRVEAIPAPAGWDSPVMSAESVGARTLGDPPSAQP
ncbi:hypothetical protein ACHZ98_35510 [Streptomyces sp. MAR4 CNY-716]